MTIRFDEIEISRLPNFKGGEKEFAAHMFFDGTNRIFKGYLEPGASIGLHTHEESCEVIFIISGNGSIMEQEPGGAPETRSVSSGECLYCPKGHTHSLMNTSNDEELVFYAVVPEQ